MFSFRHSFVLTHSHDTCSMFPFTKLGACSCSQGCWLGRSRPAYPRRGSSACGGLSLLLQVAPKKRSKEYVNESLQAGRSILPY